MNKNCEKTNQQKFSIVKVIKKKDYESYVKRKGYDSSFNSLIDKNDLV